MIFKITNSVEQLSVFVKPGPGFQLMHVTKGHNSVKDILRTSTIYARAFDDKASVKVWS